MSAPDASLAVHPAPAVDLHDDVECRALVGRPRVARRPRAGGTPGADKKFAATFTGAVPGDGVYALARKGFTATPLFVVARRGGGVATVNCV